MRQMVGALRLYGHHSAKIGSFWRVCPKRKMMPKSLAEKGSFWREFPKRKAVPKTCAEKQKVAAGTPKIHSGAFPRVDSLRPVHI